MPGKEWLSLVCVILLFIGIALHQWGLDYLSCYWFSKTWYCHISKFFLPELWNITYKGLGYIFLIASVKNHFLCTYQTGFFFSELLASFTWLLVFYVTFLDIKFLFMSCIANIFSYYCFSCITAFLLYLWYSLQKSLNVIQSNLGLFLFACFVFLSCLRNFFLNFKVIEFFMLGL